MLSLISQNFDQLKDSQGLAKSLGFILWEVWISKPKVKAIHSVLRDFSLKAKYVNMEVGEGKGSPKAGGFIFCVLWIFKKNPHCLADKTFHSCLKGRNVRRNRMFSLWWAPKLSGFFFSKCLLELIHRMILFYWQGWLRIVLFKWILQNCNFPQFSHQHVSLFLFQTLSLFLSFSISMPFV